MTTRVVDAAQAELDRIDPILGNGNLAAATTLNVEAVTGRVVLDGVVAGVDPGPVVARASSEAVAAHLSGIAEKIVDVVDLPCVGGDSTGSLAWEAVGVQVQGRQAGGADGQLVRQWAALDGLHPR